MFTIIKTAGEFDAAVQYAHDSQAHGYPVIGVCCDGGVLCRDCMVANQDLIRAAIRDAGSDTQWEIQAAQIHFEGDPLQCDNCYNEIESAYGKEW